ncbi:MAG: ABC transporter substrate-binding protein [Proteobacteria bacterium]|jgi:phospholipid transport system substrate-binding protein|nr:ABC transporter substrate-binding protein [Pseudomonadota bacterium]
MLKPLSVMLIAALALGFAARAEAQGTPTAFVQSVDKKVKPLLANSAANKTKILGALNQMLDFPTLCKDSLGKHWEGKTDAQRKEFTDTLKALIEKNVVKRLKDTRNHRIKYESEEITRDGATVVTIVSDGDGPRAQQLEIAYKLKKSGRSWIVVDMITDGVSLVSNYRSQFNKIITQDGWDVMIKKMKDKLAERD